jgi:hypothetical protein
MSDGVLGEKGILHIFGNLATERYGLFLGFMDAATGLFPLRIRGILSLYIYKLGVQVASAWHIIYFVYFLLYFYDKEGT